MKNEDDEDSGSEWGSESDETDSESDIDYEGGDIWKKFLKQ